MALLPFPKKERDLSLSLSLPFTYSHILQLKKLTLALLFHLTNEEIKSQTCLHVHSPK